MTIVVAGGTKGIGLELACGLSEEGEQVIVGFGSDTAAAEAAALRLTRLGRRVALVQTDLSFCEGAETLIAAVPEADTIRCIVHSAVRVLRGDLVGENAISAEDWSRALSVNAVSLLALIRAARTKLEKGSSVLYLTSRGAVRVLPDYAAVGPAKSLGEALVRYLAVELARDGIRVNALAPGFQDTAALRDVVGDKIDKVLDSAKRNSPSRRLVEPKDYIEVARFLVSEAAGMVTGQVHYVHGGADLL